MVSLLGILAGIAAVLAVVVTSLFIGVCLAIAWVTDAVHGRSQRAVRGGGGARAAMLPSAGRGRRDASGAPVASRHGDR